MVFLGKFSSSKMSWKIFLINALNQKFFQMSFRLKEQTFLCVYESTMHEKVNSHCSYISCLFHLLIVSAQVYRLRAQRDINIFHIFMVKKH